MNTTVLVNPMEGVYAISARPTMKAPPTHVAAGQIQTEEQSGGVELCHCDVVIRSQLKCAKISKKETCVRSESEGGGKLFALHSVCILVFDTHDGFLINKLHDVVLAAQFWVCRVNSRQPEGLPVI